MQQLKIESNKLVQSLPFSLTMPWLKATRSSRNATMFPASGRPHLCLPHVLPQKLKPNIHPPIGFQSFACGSSSGSTSAKLSSFRALYGTKTNGCVDAPCHKDTIQCLIPGKRKPNAVVTSDHLNRSFWVN